MTHEEPKPLFGKIEQEHDQIRESIASIQSFLQKPRPAVGEPAGHDWASELSEVLTSFHDEVFRHFREEEHSGFLVELEKAYPHAAHRIELLRREHDRILAEIRDALAATHLYAAGRSPENPALRRWTLSILDRVSKHEHEEGEFLQKMLYTDLGQAD